MTDHDRLFKELIMVFFFDFLELFLPELAVHLNRASVEFLDKEVFTDVTTLLAPAQTCAGAAGVGVVRRSM